MESSSSVSNNSMQTSSSSNADSYFGSLLSVISKSEIRYEGTLYCLNPGDSTLGLKNVRSYGTEERKRSGEEVLPSNNIYDYIVFRGSDIKELQVKTAPPPQMEEPIYNDPAIIQSNYYGEPSFSSKSVSSGIGTSTNVRLYSEPSSLNAISYPAIVSPHGSENQMGIPDSSYSTHSAFSSSGMPKQWQQYNEAPGSFSGANQQHFLSSSTILYPQNQTHGSIASPNLSQNVPPAHLLSTPSSIYPNATSPLTPDQLSMPFTDSFSSTFPTSYHSTLVNSNGLTMPFPLTYQSTSTIGAPVVNKVFPDPISSLGAQSSSYPMPPISDLTSEPLLRHHSTFLTANQLSQPNLSQLSPEMTSYPHQKNINANFSSSVTTPAVQSPLLPLPPPSQKIQDDPQFTEEFDFEAMNEKFKKAEIWGHLGKASQRDKTEGIQENGRSGQDSWEINPDLASNSELKPSYNKDDFFDTISCNSICRGARNGQNQLSERIKFNSETFGNFPQRNQWDYDGSGIGRGNYHGQYHHGRRYNYPNRGRGGYFQR